MWLYILLGVGILGFISFVKPFQKKVSFAGKNVIITGGSAGIGRDLSLLIAKEGASSITILARTQSKLNEIASELSSSCKNILTISCDVSSNDAVKEAIDQSVAKFGIPDILITCAGLSNPGYFLQQDISVTEHTMKVDFFGTLYATHRVAHHMSQRAQGGHIVMISSTLACLGIVGFSSYCPAKYAIKGLADVLQSELSPYNITFSVVYPPDTNTPGYANENLTKPLDCLEISAMNSIFEPKDVAATIIAGVKNGDYHIAHDFMTKMFISMSNSIAPRQYGPLEALVFPAIALFGFITRVFNDSKVSKHFKLAKKNKK